MALLLSLQSERVSETDSVPEDCLLESEHFSIEPEDFLSESEHIVEPEVEREYFTEEPEEFEFFPSEEKIVEIQKPKDIPITDYFVDDFESEDFDWEAYILKHQLESESNLNNHKNIQNHNHKTDDLPNVWLTKNTSIQKPNQIPYSQKVSNNNNQKINQNTSSQKSNNSYSQKVTSNNQNKVVQRSEFPPLPPQKNTTTSLPSKTNTTTHSRPHNQNQSSQKPNNNAHKTNKKPHQNKNNSNPRYTDDFPALPGLAPPNKSVAVSAWGSKAHTGHYY